MERDKLGNDCRDEEGEESGWDQSGITEIKPDTAGPYQRHNVLESS